MLEIFKEETLILILIIQIGMITRMSIEVTYKELLKPLKFFKENNNWNHPNLKNHWPILWKTLKQILNKYEETRKQCLKHKTQCVGIYCWVLSVLSQVFIFSNFILFCEVVGSLRMLFSFCYHFFNLFLFHSRLMLG